MVYSIGVKCSPPAWTRCSAPRCGPAKWSCSITCPPTKWPDWPKWWKPAAHACYTCRLTRPILTPIERAFSKLNPWLRTVQARTRETLEAVIQTATDWISGHDAKNWFDHCGYHVH